MRFLLSFAITNDRFRNSFCYLKYTLILILTNLNVLIETLNPTKTKSKSYETIAVFYLYEIILIKMIFSVLKLKKKNNI